jgi:hypothetical protein
MTNGVLLRAFVANRERTVASNAQSTRKTPHWVALFLLNSQVSEIDGSAAPHLARCGAAPQASSARATVLPRIRHRGARVSCQRISNGGTVGGVGTDEARYAIDADPQIRRRFDPFALPRWTETEDFRNFVSAFGKIFPLRKPSLLGERALVQRLLQASEGITGLVTRLLSLAPPPYRAEALHSWLRRVAAPYRMTPVQLQHAVGVGPYSGPSYTHPHVSVQSALGAPDIRNLARIARCDSIDMPKPFSRCPISSGLLALNSSSSSARSVAPFVESPRHILTAP